MPTHLKQSFQCFAVSAPVERKVTREKISFLTEESAVTLDFHREQPDVPQHASYTVLRNRLDPWLMEQAEQAGAQFIPVRSRRCAGS